MSSEPFDFKEGKQQSVVESALLFTFGIDDTKSLMSYELMEEVGALCAGVDNTYFICPPKQSSPFSEHKERVLLAGLKLNVKKPK